ncbi:MFS transporter [Pantoea cypripedii]|uniref:MFS transporter n=1 Tax=Pantoea cypripedii TaxID=55209 RepID=UPI001AEA0E4F|nr:MFS transporter [Pantoea cypripedii]MBP2199607.1 MFS family permease [Pantoea cypripedii]
MKLAWYSDLTNKEKRTYWACLGGYTLDSLDSTIYSLVLPVLLGIHFLTRADAGWLGSVSLIGSALGGWGAGILADRIGRVKVMQLTVLWVALFTAATAFCHTFWQFFLLRFCQGLGYGGEVIVGAVLITEVIRADYRGRVAASIQSGYAIGYAISLGLFPLVMNAFPPEQAWRVFFLIGLIPAVLIWFIRRLVPESATFSHAQQPRERKNIGIIFSRPYLRTTITSTLLASGIFGGAYIVITWLPAYLKLSLGLPVTQMSGYLFINILGSLIGPFIYGRLSDRMGRWRAVILFLLLQSVVISLYMFAHLDLDITLVLGLFLGAFQGGLASGLTPAFSELYPTAIRASGAGFCASFGRGFGSLMPAAVGLFSMHYPLGLTMGVLAIVSYCIALLAAFMLPDATGVDLERVEADEALSPQPVATRDAH